MDEQSKANKDAFFYPRAGFKGEFSPEALAFNANLQEFTQRISIICNLETGGKISAEEAYAQIKLLWKALKASKAHLIDVKTPPDVELPPEQ